jgi:mono/diheme cytochrome c family protein
VTAFDIVSKGTILLALVGAALGTGLAGPQGAPTDVTGDAERGGPLFLSYKCYACHGYQGETGSPRLVPMGRTEEGFVSYVQSPRTQGMPNYSSVSRQELVDIYAYIRSISPDAPAVESIPLLESILESLEEDSN